ncbi:MAG: hypothetical protein A2X35_10685 [Elusimicrobia bacterium GWA2_61_42]|nr:MAG: hypothetical protein A2X35_10685 [Elusimicrobia bacterium GWA2_61_42]OGR74727.1 MAG: hypothetical protein A2X38_02650 [Elusimicrobia bacterium GWC2_61_25]
MVFKVLFVLLLACVPARADEALLSHPYWQLPYSTAAVVGSVPAIVNGETLEYDIYWGAIYVGRAFIRIAGVVDISSRPAWHIVSEARSGSFLANFYKVDDRNDSWMDVDSLYSYGYYKKISEGKHFFNEWVIYDGAGKRYYGDKMNRKRSVTPFEGPLEIPVNDVLSAVYRLRAMAIAPGSTVEMDVNTKKNWRLSIKAGKREKVSTGYGKKKCIVFEPMAGDQGIFVAKAGRRMLVWITDDDLKLPMVLKAEIFIGSVTAKLVRRVIKP